MDFRSPPTFNILNIQTWKVKMSMYLKALGIHVYFSRVANHDSAFIVCNSLISLGEQEQYYAGSDSDVGSDASNLCYMVQRDNSLEVTIESEVDEDVEMS